ncbi:hypothetical protein BGZ95_002184 [Linnemannia exigua]|uniref:Uncharacterized protein n=1 Tax=Linnemannia exigua TaxID=604196 RepID=A0AAD4D5W0_9FUNG|nr:hypothetical protein BGZ95_002184 [Linnemannia exigua]
MRSTSTFFALFLALFAISCNAAAIGFKTPSTELDVEVEKSVSFDIEKRGLPLPTAAFDATVDLLFKEHTQIVVKAFADVCTDADVSAAISTSLNVQVSGLLNADFGLGTKLSGALKASVKAAVKAEVDAEIKKEFTATLKVNIGNIITKVCPAHDAACIKLQAKKIVSEAAKLTVKASAKIQAKIQVSLAAKIKAAVDLQVKKFSVNLILIKINVSGEVKVAESVAAKFKAAAGICASAAAQIQAKEVIAIKAICSV